MRPRCIAAVTALAISVAVGPSASKAALTPNPPADSTVAPSRDLPAEVREWLDRRSECFRGAIDGTSWQRFRCNELSTDKAALLRRYSNNETVVRILGLTPPIQPL